MYSDSHSFMHHHHHDEPTTDPVGEETPAIAARVAVVATVEAAAGVPAASAPMASAVPAASAHVVVAVGRRAQSERRSSPCSPRTPANGYSLMKQIAERAEGEWSPSPGSVYPTLAQLVDEGLITPTGTEKGTDYALTDAGREYVEQNAEALAAVWAEQHAGVCLTNGHARQRGCPDGRGPPVQVRLDRRPAAARGRAAR